MSGHYFLNGAFGYSGLFSRAATEKRLLNLHTTQRSDRSLVVTLISIAMATEVKTDDPVVTNGGTVTDEPKVDLSTSDTMEQVKKVTAQVVDNLGETAQVLR